MGKAGRADVKYGIDGAGPPANSHQGHGWEQFTDAILEAVNQEDRPIVYLLWGQTGPEQDPDADESKASDLESASSKPIVCLPGILRMPPFQSDQRIFREPWVVPIDWQIENIHK